MGNDLVFEVKAKEDILQDFPAGGVLPVFVEEMLERGFFLYIPIYNDFKCDYRKVKNIGDIRNIYIDSHIECDEKNILSEIKEKLVNGNKVCVIGSPCTILKMKLEFKEYEKELYTIAWDCKGQASLDFYHRSIKGYEEDGKKVLAVTSGGRKLYGSWANAKKRVRFSYSDGTSRTLEFGEKFEFIEGVNKRIAICSKCVECKYDYMKFDYYIEPIDEESIIAINSEKGKNFWEELESKWEKCDLKREYVPLGKSDNGNICKKRKYFNFLIKTHEFNTSIDMALNGLFDIGLASGYKTANYGGALTQYAMYKVLKDMGYSVLLIERPLFSDNIPDKSDVLNVESLYADYEKAPLVENVYDCIRYNDFCKMFLVGSDQFYNTYLYHATQEFFSLKWVKEEKPKMAYAASFGFDTLWDSETQLARRKFFLKRFDKFSVREKGAQHLLKKTIGMEAEWVLDPVFLCDKSHFDMLAKQYSDIEQRYNEDYIFCYILNPSKEKENIISKVAQKLNMTYYTFSDMECEVKNGDKKWNLNSYTRANINEWMFALQNAKYVITDSFHGTCFSIIYKKTFITINNEIRGKSRFSTLASVLKISDRIIEKESDLGDILNFCMDYKSIDSIIDKEKKRSFEWLKGNIDTYVKQEVKYSAYDFFLENMAQIHNVANIRIYTNLRELALSEGSSVDEIINKMPPKSLFLHEQGKIGEPIIGTPVPYGILEIYKGTNYFAKILFYQMTISDSKPIMYQARYINKHIIDWERYIGQDEYRELEQKVSNLEKDINFMLRKFSAYLPN